MEHIGYIIGKNIQLPNYLGMLVEGEDLTEYITLKMKKDETLEGLDYYLTYKNADGAGDTFALTKEITDKEILLSFVVTNAFTAVKGKMEIQISGFDVADDPEEDDPVWKSFVCTISIARALHPEEIQPDTPTVFVQYLSQMQELKEAAETAQGKAEDAQEAAETAQGKAEDAQDAAEDAQGKAEDAQTAAENAQTAAEGYAQDADNARIASVSETISPDDGGTNVITFTYKDGTVKTFTVTNGHTGAPFAIYRTYASIAEMNADLANVPEGKFVIITSTTEDPDNAKLYVRGSSAFTFITDLSGAQGIQGPDGLAATITVGSVQTGSAGSSASVTNSGTSSAAVFDFVIPKGDKGDTGSTGSAATISVGTTTTGQAGTSASVTNSGTSSAAVFNFTIPKGDKGDTGSTGAAAGFGTPTASVDANVGTPSVTVTATGSDTAKVFDFAFKNLKGDKGDTGSSGSAATVTVGTTTTGQAGTNASVTNSGTSSAAVFNFTIPKGDKGDTGSTGPGVASGGTTGQFLKKKSSTNYDTEWVDDDAYRKPSGGIPSTDMSSAVQTSLGKADTALQAHQDISGKADKVSGATTGNLAKLDSNGNLADSGIDSTKVLTESDVKDNTTTQSATKPLSANMGYSLQQEVNTLKARGRFLSLWDCITGLPVSFPLSVPYAYMSGDYFVISNSVSYIKDNTSEYDDTADYAVNVYTVYQDVLYKCNTAIVGGEAWNPAHWDAVTNDYIPTGSSYAGTASSVVATEEIFVNDTYIYDGTYWLHQINTGGKVAFQNIAGNPDDNLALASKFANVVKHDSDIPGSATPINADQLNGHADTYFLPKSDVVDTLSSTATDKALSAKQGKVLNDALSDISAIKTKTFVYTSHLDGEVLLHRVGSVVMLSYGGNIKEIPQGSSTWNNFIPQGYRPATSIVQVFYSGGDTKGIQSTFYSDGSVSLYNYGYAIGSSFEAGRMMFTYITTDALPN